MIRSLTVEHAVGLAGEQGAGDRPVAALGLVQDRQGPGARPTDLNLVGPLVKMTGVGTIDLGTKQIGFSRRAETRDDHRRPGPRQRAGRVRHPRDDRRAVGAARKSIRTCRASSTIPISAYAKLKEMGKGLFGPEGRRPWCGARRPARRTAGTAGGQQAAPAARPASRAAARRPARRDPRQSAAAGPGRTRPAHRRQDGAVASAAATDQPAAATSAGRSIRPRPRRADAAPPRAGRAPRRPPAAERAASRTASR